ncbi:MAG: outer membrane lipoprotein-sorting protein [Chitinivibrionales bacterium]
MKMRKTLFLLCITAVLPFVILAQDKTTPDATAIVKASDQLMRGESSRGEMSMTIVKPAWKRTISMRFWSKGDEFMLIRITAPARDQGMMYLKRYDELWQWVPRVERTIKIPPSMMMQSWMGSDFTNDDLVRSASIVDDYTHTFAGDTIIRDHPSFIIHMEPRPQAPVVWDHVRMWIGKQDSIWLRAEYYGEDGKLANTLVLSEIQMMDSRRIPTHWEMIPADEQGQRTILEYESMDFDVSIENSFFSLQNMRRMRK